MKKNILCNETMDLYLSLDKHELLPFSITRHLLFCKKCRTQVRILSAAEKTGTQAVFTKKTVTMLEEESIESLMKKIAPLPLLLPDTKPVSLKKWIISGIALICTLFLIPLGGTIGFIPSSFGNFFSVPFYIFAGSATAAYCVLFVASNLDFFVKQAKKLIP